MAVSITVALLLRPLNAHTVFVTGSYTIPSGFRPAGIRATFSSDSRSNTTTAFAPPSEMYPYLPVSSSATPWIPFSPAIWPTTLPVSVSTTSTFTPCVM